MRNVALLLTLLTVAMVVVLIRRLLEAGAPGPKTWVFAALTVVALIATVRQWRRTRAVAGPAPAPPG